MPVQNDVRVSWSAGLNPPSPVAYYKVYARLGQVGDYDTLMGQTLDATTHLDLFDLAPNDYNFVVTAVDAPGQESSKSGGSNLVTVLALPAPPVAPSNAGAVFI